MTAQPLLRDEYERPRVEVKQSTLNSQIAGEGLFTLRDFKKEDIMAFYNGIKGMGTNQMLSVEDITLVLISKSIPREVRQDAVDTIRDHPKRRVEPGRARGQPQYEQLLRHPRSQVQPLLSEQRKVRK